MNHSKKLELAAVASIPIIMTLANSMLIPLLPIMEKKLGISSVQSSLIITVYAAIAIICIPIAGYLSDRFGRKKIIIPSLILAAIGGGISGLGAWLMSGMGAYTVILAGRFVQGIGAAGAFPIVIPLVGDMFKSEEEVTSGLGIVETSNTFGKVLSPILGSALALLVWFLPFLIIPFFCLISILAVAFLIKVPANKQSEKVTLKSFVSSIKQILQQKGRWLYAIFGIGGIGMFFLFGFFFYLSTILEEQYQIDGIRKGLLLAIPLTAVCLFSYVTGKLVGEDKPRMKWFTFIGLVIVAASMIVCGLVPTKALLLLLSLLFAAGLGIGAALPCLDALITEGIDKKQRGTITSLYSSMRFIGVAAGPPVTSLLLGKESLLFYTFAAIAGVGGLCALLAIKPESAK
ncbi:MFS transporter, ACDE family, multidrug resistance protein [Paenibacillus sp. 1_12]|uniref:MFS transporter n=1 Tax=Paenibacillus sp. 1_12 TaxID=1566278 RepID=UPI0008E1A3E0|nr:MFS transporter [Paenibacillus sp. 1_12]SFL75436.1 MFS transporter, ACDE family, multidrug resistance protein [Paenibacillus sp. 1_12]